MLNAKFTIRRKRALISYCLIVIELLLVGVFIIFADSEMRLNFDAASALIISINAVLVGIITQYHYQAQSDNV